MFWGSDKDYKLCPHCGYRMYKPFPEVCPNPKCLKKLEDEDTFEKHLQAKIAQSQKGEIAPKEKSEAESGNESSSVSKIEVSKRTASKMIKGVRVKKKTQQASVDLSSEVIVFTYKSQYFKNFGIVSEDRIILYNRNSEYSYIHELSCNLDYIASSIMGGEIDTLFLRSERSNALEKVLYIRENNIIYYVYGVFPDKQGYWILKQMIKTLKDALSGKDIHDLEKIDLYNIQTKFDSVIKYIMDEYMKMAEVISDKEIPSVEDKLRFDYFGMSYKSIGTISKILGNDLPIEMDRNIPDDQIQEYVESLLTAKIEAIAATTIANTAATPVYLSVKLGYDKYRYLVFEKLRNDYFIYMLIDGNLKKYKSVIEVILNLIEPFTENIFRGDLEPFKILRKKMTAFFAIRTY